MKRFIAGFLMLTTGIFFIPVHAQVIEAPANVEPIIREAVPNAEPVPYVHIREADVFWSKTIWRVIDMREKINQPLYYPISPTNGRKNLMTIILEGLKENMIKAYDSDQLNVVKTYEELMVSLQSTDSITMWRDYPPYEAYDTVIFKEFKPEDVLMFRLREFWVFDKQRSVLECRIMAMCPVINLYDNDEFKGTKPLFWIHFPEARKVFAKYEVFNRQNDAFRMSYDDLFFKRIFSSYIMKESNVHDRFINEYAPGLDALLESERIKEEIFILEHDLWEY
jgi:gliding motility associated protien GldN